MPKIMITCVIEELFVQIKYQPFFRVSVHPFPNSFAYQIILEADTETRQLCHVTLDALDCAPYSGPKHIMEIQIDTDICRLSE